MTTSTKTAYKLNYIGGETYHVTGTMFQFMAPNTKTAKALMEKSLAHKWGAENLKKAGKVATSADIPSTCTVSFMQKNFYHSVKNVVFNLIDAGEPLDKAIAVGNKLTKAYPGQYRLMDFAEYAVISKVIKAQIAEALSMVQFK